MDETIFKTVLKNERKKGVILWDGNGGGLGILGPGQSRTLEGWNINGLYSPFAEVVWREDGTIVTQPNPEFPAPKSKWLITVLNKAGGEMERRIIGHREVALPKGLARTFELEPEDPMAVYSRMEIIRVMGRSDERNEMFPSYSRFCPVVRDKFFDRPADELMELERELEKLATDIEQ
ncbi:MAG: hypothetical protein MUQ00_13345 [Candidatus Aminicenantes bacterium]|nr:hypothetical protein [Candidatus Aminicenantes bacterium]